MGTGLGIGKGKKVEVMPRSKNKNKKLEIVERANLVTGPRFSLYFSHFFLSGVIASPVIYPLNPKLVSQWLPFS